MQVNTKIEFETELIDDKLAYSDWFYLVIAGFTMWLISFFLPNGLFEIAATSVAIILILIGFILKKIKRSIRISGNELISEKSIFGEKYTTIYAINKIENLEYKQQVKSNSYRSKSSFKIAGVDITPEKPKKYYYHNEIISFDYEKKTIEIGKWKKYFGGHNINNLLKQKISLIKKDSRPAKETRREYKK